MKAVLGPCAAETDALSSLDVLQSLLGTNGVESVKWVAVYVLSLKEIPPRTMVRVHRHENIAVSICGDVLEDVHVV
jgi:hypothetical protein